MTTKFETLKQRANQVLLRLERVSGSGVVHTKNTYIAKIHHLVKHIEKKGEHIHIDASGYSDHTLRGLERLVNEAERWCREKGFW